MIPGIKNLPSLMYDMRRGGILRDCEEYCLSKTAKFYQWLDSQLQVRLIDVHGKPLTYSTIFIQRTECVYYLEEFYHSL